MSDVEKLTQGLIETIGALPHFPVTAYMNRLYNITRTASILTPFKNDLTIRPIENDEAPTQVSGLKIDGRDESDAINTLAVQSVVTAISSLNSTSDKPGFRACVKGAVSDEHTFEDMSEVTALLLAEFISRALKKAGHPTLSELHATEGVFDELKETITGPQFLGSIDIQDQLCPLYCAYLLFVLEYLHNGPGFAPHFGAAFADSPSNEALQTWCEDLMSKPEYANEEGIRSITKFSVQAASTVMVPVVNGKMQPSEGPAMSRALRDISLKRAVAASAAAASVNNSISLPKTKEARPVKGLPAVHKSIRLPGTMLTTKSDDELEEIINEATRDFRSICTQNRVIWDTMSDDWVDAVGRSARNIDRSVKESQSHTTSVGGTVTTTHTKITTVTGKPVADWIKTVKGSYSLFFTNKSPNTTDVETKSKSAAGAGTLLGCFIAGTSVATSAGDIPIEKIEEGTIIMTNAATGRFGVASDEEVINVVRDSTLIGFNKEGVFATAGHVFHTTTGLRAIEPQHALAENPWLDVGKLEVGHMLYRLAEDRQSYELIPVESIQVEFVSSCVVYGVHMREGDRSYHANGYQVAVGYPEITIKSVAAALSKLPRAKRVEMLVGIKELLPIFVKLGLGGVTKLLDRELRLAKVGKIAPLRNHRGVKLLDMRRTMHLTPVSSRIADETLPAGYRLPLLQIFEGALLLDDDVVQRVAYDARKEELTWSRCLKGSLVYEHGVLSFRCHGMSGKGAVWITKEANPAKMPEDKKTIVPFVASKATCPLPEGPDNNADGKGGAMSRPRFVPSRVLERRATPVSLEGTTPVESSEAVSRGLTNTASIGAGVPIGPITTKPAPSVAFPPNLGPNPTAAQVRRAAQKAINQGVPIRKVIKWMTKMLKQIKEDNNNEEPAEPDTEETETPNGNGEEDGVDSGVDIDAPSDEEDDGFFDPFVDEEDYYASFFDREEWMPDDPPRIDCVNPQRWGSLTIATYHTRAEGAGGLRTPVILMPELDRLRDDLNRTRAADDQLEDLYSSSVYSNANGTLHGTVQFTAAAAVASLSDQYVPPTDEEVEAADFQTIVYPTRDLTFTQGEHKSDVKIPFLFYLAEIDFKYNMREFNGAAFEFNQEMTGYLGHRHFFESRGSVSEFPPARAALVNNLTQRRADVSMRVAITPSGAVPRSTVALSGAISGPMKAAANVPSLLTTPAPVSRTLVKAQNLDTDDLVNKIVFTENTLHQTTQSIVKKVMLYHMDDGDREEFTNQAKPTDLPLILTDGLDSVMPGLSNWVKYKYARAYVAFSLSNMTKAGEEALREKYRLSLAQKDKIWYYWSGAGEGCLAREKEYNTLNELASAYALREIVDGALDPYLQDDEEKTFTVGEWNDRKDVKLSGGQKWAREMLYDIDNPWFLGSMSLVPVNNDGSVPLNRWCSIMHGLSPKVENLYDYALELFEAVITHFVGEMDGKTPADVEDILGYSANDWIMDAIGHIVDLVLDENSDLDPEVRQMINDDLKALAEERGEAATASEERIKEMYLEEQTIVVASIGSIMMALPDALQAFNKADLIHKLVNKRYSTTTGVSPQKMRNLKGGLMIGMFVAYGALTGSITADWQNLDLDQRVACSLMLTKMYLDGVSGCLTAFRDYKASKIGNAVNNQTIQNTITSGKTRLLNTRRAALMEEMNGRIRGEPPTRSALADAVSDADMKKGAFLTSNERNVIWNEKWAERRKVMKATAKGSPLRFTNMAVKAFQALALLAGVACFVAMSVVLLRDLDDLTKLGKRLVYAQVAFLILEAAVELAAVFAVGSMAVCLPVIGVIVAVVGLVLALVFMFTDSQKEEEPPKSEMEIFLDEKAKPLIDDMPSPPAAKLQYGVTARAWTPNADRILTITAKNTSGQPVTIQTATLNFLGGDGDDCLFAQSGMRLLEAEAIAAADDDDVDDSAKDGIVAQGGSAVVTKGRMAVEMRGGTSAMSEAYQVALARTEVTSTVTSYDFRVVSIQDVATNADLLLEIPPNGGFRWHVHGTVNPMQPDSNGNDGDGESSIQVEEIQESGDKCRKKWSIERK
ncbi:hypothetical protein DL764_008985 [Monosporascus ibericus]|uniref:Uncharacterized protein n=1 Tax=Monosporascus ibericus TaxID=155417 RepID=A0A4Q4SYD7_9PEZI|nr:hypothetical protein DL764_008985 [Monosporascus ibericus]